MSYLREIMGRLRERAATAPAEASPLPAPGEGTAAHLGAYRETLRGCGDAMLRYEWAWLADHLSSLRLSLGHEVMRQTLGGRGHVDQLLREADAFQAELAREMRDRRLKPSSRTAPLVPQEHAWELSDPAVRRAWGIETPT